MRPTKKTFAALVLIWAVLAAGCASDSELREAGQRANAVEPKQDYGNDISDFTQRVKVSRTLYSKNDVARFLSSRDSLVTDVNEFIREHPHAESDPEFVRLLNSLSALDTLVVDQMREPEYSALDDSLALAERPWPEADNSASEQARLFAVSDSLFPVIESNRIDFWISYFTGPGRERFERAMYRMELHRPTVEAILAEKGLPQELICIAFIESGFAMKAVSSARAVGPWQFINGTARRYNLRVNWWYDERCDIVASTYAAANYLTDLYGIWGDWFLAFAAYNCGEYRVARQIARQKTNNFWQLDLPTQTERYVPKFLAALYIMREPHKYGFTIPNVEPNRFDLVTVSVPTDLDVLARSAGTTSEVIRDLNPQLKRAATPPMMEVHVKVPKGAGDATQTALASLPPSERVAWTEHKVKRGETLSHIAGQYGTTVEALRDTNNLKRSSMLRIGQVVIVPVPGGSYAEAASSKPSYMNPRESGVDRAALERYAQRAATLPSGNKITYKVKRGDTLSEIADRYSTSVSKIRSWNNLSRKRHIYTGQRLVIYTRASGPSSTEAPAVALTPGDDYTKLTHVVARGESLFSISKQYNVQLQDLMAWNNRGSRSMIKAGETLVIYQRTPANSDGAR
ncbi:MAG TPA: LysM peptidoglycan-binding domain-containing protein [Candidatus Krumholzibacteria bacterium]|nr:LysM peptidoglycan-binding domain-containing protein [Candidatus Krumholzibacteria bacterium]